MDNNTLCRLPDGLLHNQRRLQSLSLRNNRLHVIKESTLYREQLVRLDVGGNPLECGCHVLWLLELVEQSAANNASLWRTPLSDRDAAGYKDRQQQTILADAGTCYLSSARLSCQSRSDSADETEPDYCSEPASIKSDDDQHPPTITAPEQEIATIYAAIQNSNSSAATEEHEDEGKEKGSEKTTMSSSIFNRVFPSLKVGLNLLPALISAGSLMSELMKNQNQHQLGVDSPQRKNHNKPPSVIVLPQNKPIRGPDNAHIPWLIPFADPSPKPVRVAVADANQVEDPRHYAPANQFQPTHAHNEPVQVVQEEKWSAPFHGSDGVPATAGSYSESDLAWNDVPNSSQSPSPPLYAVGQNVPLEDVVDMVRRFITTTLADGERAKTAAKDADALGAAQQLAVDSSPPTAAFPMNDAEGEKAVSDRVVTTAPPPTPSTTSDIIVDEVYVDTTAGQVDIKSTSTMNISWTDGSQLYHDDAISAQVSATSSDAEKDVYIKEMVQERNDDDPSLVTFNNRHDSGEVVLVGEEDADLSVATNKDRVDRVLHHSTTTKHYRPIFDRNVYRNAATSDLHSSIKLYPIFNFVLVLLLLLL